MGYRIISYMRIEPEEQELMTKEEAEKELEQLEFMNYDDKFSIEKVE